MSWKVSKCWKGVKYFCFFILGNERKTFKELFETGFDWSSEEHCCKY